MEDQGLSLVRRLSRGVGLHHRPAEILDLIQNLKMQSSLAGGGRVVAPEARPLGGGIVVTPEARRLGGGRVLAPEGPPLGGVSPGGAGGGAPEGLLLGGGVSQGGLPLRGGVSQGGLPLGGGGMCSEGLPPGRGLHPGGEVATEGLHLVRELALGVGQPPGGGGTVKEVAANSSQEGDLNLAGTSHLPEDQFLRKDQDNPGLNQG